MSTQIDANIRQFIVLASKARAIMDSEADWETIYDLVFSDAIKGALDRTGINFDYLYPDESYEDDVVAYVSAVQDKADELRKVQQALERIVS